MKNLFKRIKVWYALRKAHAELDEAIIDAEEWFKMYNKRFYVIADYNNKLRVLSYSQLKQMKKQGFFSSKCKESDFIRESFYYTPSRLDQTYMKPETKEQKRREWIQYYKTYRLHLR